MFHRTSNNSVIAIDDISSIHVPTDADRDGKYQLQVCVKSTGKIFTTKADSWDHAIRLMLDLQTQLNDLQRDSGTIKVEKLVKDISEGVRKLVITSGENDAD